MKTKFILLFLAVFLPLSAFQLNADEKKPEQKIPLTKTIGSSVYDNFETGSQMIYTFQSID